MALGVLLCPIVALLVVDDDGILEGAIEMASLEERVSYLEGRVEEHSRSVGELRELIVAVDRRVTALDQKMDRRFDALEARFEAIDRRFESMEDRFSAQEQRSARRFAWVIGLQGAILVAFVTSLFGLVARHYFP